ncbi:beta-ketoacyl-[acyl-carrier-protein] synthase family protein [Acidobacteriota bacterium]
MTSIQPKRVVVTGMGVVTPYGCEIADYWTAFVEGRSCISRISRFDASDYPVQIGGQVSEVKATPFLPDAFLRRNDLCTNIGMLAGGQALEASGLGALSEKKRPIAIIVGTGFGSAHGLEEAFAAFYQNGWQRMHPFTVPKNMFNSLASNLSIHYKLGGGHHAVGVACASGAVALGEAFLRIRYGEEKIVLSGGADAPLCASILGAWINLRILSKNPDPPAASRPFDLNRDGLVMSEGAAMLVIEEYEHARDRGAPIIGEILGYGSSSDASHITAPERDGQCDALRKALTSAGIRPEEVDYINAHGTSTKLNDKIETQAIKEVFGKHSRNLAVSSNKSMMGHTMGGAGALELAATLLTIKENIVPPTINYETPDPECDLDYVPNKARELELSTAVTNSFAFGGNNSVLVVRQLPEGSE